MTNVAAAGEPVLRLAQLRAIKLSYDLEVALASKIGGHIVIEILTRLRDRAADSMHALATCDPLATKAVITCQNSVQYYEEFFKLIGSIIAEGKQAEQQLSDDEREEFIDMLTQSVEGQDKAVELGFVGPNQSDS